MKIHVKEKYAIPWGCHTLLLSILAIGQVNAEVLTADFNGDGREDLVVGVPLNNSAGKQNSGSVTVFYGTDRGLPSDADEVFHQDTPGILGIAEANDRFASVVAVGDFDGDGFDDLAAGVPLEDLTGVGPDNRGVDAGAVNVIYGSASGLQVSGNQVFTAGSKDPLYAQSDSAFGEALTSGDFKGDGMDDLAVGAPFWDVRDAPNCGAVFVFLGSANGLVARGGALLGQWQARVPGIPEKGDRLGDEVVAADFDQDGFDDIAIGIPDEDIGAIVDAGAVAIVYGANNQFSFDGSRSHLHLDNVSRSGSFVEADDSFGDSLEAGDFNGDGFPDLAIGHPFEDASAKNAGAVSIIYGGRFGASGGIRQYWPADVFNLPDRPEFGDGFGYELAAGDFDGNGADDLAVSTPFEDLESNRRKDVGAVTVLYGTGIGLTVGARSEWHQDKGGVEDSRNEDDFFGFGLSVGDFNNDNFADLVVGVPGEDINNGRNQENAGMAHIFYGSAQRLSTHPGLGREIITQGTGANTPAASRAGDQFGGSLP